MAMETSPPSRSPEDPHGLPAFIRDQLLLQVYGANTDVGKTVVSAGLCRAASQAGLGVEYVKPLQTGQDTDADFVRRNVPTGVSCRTLYHWSTPTSPHLAAALDNKVVSGEEVVSRLISLLKEVTRPHSFTLVETAGGVLSPGPSTPITPQADLYRPLRLPVLLVGDGRLGGISCTLSAYESLVSRGYEVWALVIVEGSSSEGAPLDNTAAIKACVEKGKGRKGTGPCVFSFPPLPTDAKVPLEEWYRLNEAGFREVLHGVQVKHEARISRVEEMVGKAMSQFWWPFTQHKGLGAESLTVIDSAHGDRYTGVRGGQTETLFDACCSWWTQGVGHGSPDMAGAVAEAAGRYGHIIFPNHVHEPALRLAELLLEETGAPGKGWASRVFFSDDGSTAMEIALKMALKAYDKRQGRVSQEVAVVTQQGCYHGDTLGCMDMCAPTVFNLGQHSWYVPRTLSLEPPTLAWTQGVLRIHLPQGVQCEEEEGTTVFPSGREVLDLGRRLRTPLAEVYKGWVRAEMEAFTSRPNAPVLAAVLLEPVLMGAGGMLVVDPLFQRVVVEEARSRGMVVVMDEIASGLHRLIVPSASVSYLGVRPDIACFGKTLSGGYLPLAVTLTSEEVFLAFQGGNKTDALLHGHSYTANPLACAAAVQALETYQSQLVMTKRDEGLFSVWDEPRVRQLSTLKAVDRAVSIGTVLAVELKADETGYAASNASARVVHELRQRGILARPLGNVVYLMTSQMTGRDTCQWLLECLEGVLGELDGLRHLDGNGVKACVI